MFRCPHMPGVHLGFLQLTRLWRQQRDFGFRLGLSIPATDYDSGGGGGGAVAGKVSSYSISIS